nr:MAG TPA: major capsid protein [Caudoviricetes sp.]
MSSPTDAQLAASAQWKIVADAKLIPIARIISNG